MRNCPLSDRQDQGVASPTAGATQRARVPARGVDGHLCCSRSRDGGGSEGDFQLRAACDRGALRDPVDQPHGSRNKLAAIYRENKALLHLSEGNSAGRKGPNDGGWAGTSAQRIERVAGLED